MNAVETVALSFMLMGSCGDGGGSEPVKNLPLVSSVATIIR